METDLYNIIMLRNFKSLDHHLKQFLTKFSIYSLVFEIHCQKANCFRSPLADMQPYIGHISDFEFFRHSEGLDQTCLKSIKCLVQWDLAPDGMVPQGRCSFSESKADRTLYNHVGVLFHSPFAKRLGEMHSWWCAPQQCMLPWPQSLMVDLRGIMHGR